MIDRPRQEEEPRAIEAMGDAVERQRPDARIEQDFGARPGRGVARLHRIEIANKIAQHAAALKS